MRRTYTQRFFQISFVPFLVLVALMTMYVRANNVVSAVEEGKIAGLFSPPPAVAETAPAAPAEGEAAVVANPAVSAAPAEPAAKTAPEENAFDALNDEDLEVLQQLSSRRADLDKRASELDTREALLQAAEKRLEDKVGQLQQSRAELEKLLGQATTEQDDQVKSLVKIYETMKPKQAAAIFGQLDMSVLIKVVQEMKEAKAAPVIAEMDPMRAKALTTELMRRKELPKELPKLNP